MKMTTRTVGKAVVAGALLGLIVLCAVTGAVAWFAFEESNSERELYRALVFSVTRHVYSNLLCETEALLRESGGRVIDTADAFPPTMSVLMPQYIVVDENVEIWLSGGFKHRSVVITRDTAPPPDEHPIMTMYQITNRVYYYEE